MSETPTIPVIIIHRSDLEACTAYVASNPRLCANGVSEEDALIRLQTIIIREIDSRRSSVKMINMVLDDLITEEVHKS
jgi:hypothetical protein